MPKKEGKEETGMIRSIAGAEGVKVVEDVSEKKPKKKSSKKQTRKKRMTKTELEKTLISNFVNLQKVLTNLSIKFEDLSTNISKLLELFEISAKSFTEKYTGEEIAIRGNTDKDFLEKLDKLLEQNKTISKGIMLMEEKIRERSKYPENPENRLRGMLRRPAPRY
jgi:hypothetical protein